MPLNVAHWLHGLGLEQYLPAFEANDIDADILPQLTADDLGALGVASIGHRQRLLAAIAVLGAAPAPAAAAGDAPAQAAATDSAAERRQLTILFCDVVGSTELATRLDPEDLREVIGAYHRCVAEVLTRFGGFVAKYMGDGILAYFGYPQAHEEDAEQAVRAGLAIVDAVGGLDLPVRLEVRLGIATGLVVVGDLLGAGAAQERSVIGETPNLAARLQALAGPNTIVIADATRRDIGGLFEMRDLGPQDLKGFAGASGAWQVLGDSGVASRFEALRSGTTPLIGREEEIELLLRRWAQAKEGNGRVVLFSAEPGIGKSRLTEALQQRIAAEPHRRLRYFCSPHHQDSALYPIVGQLERAARFRRDDDPAAKQRKLAQLLAAGTGDVDELPLLGELLGLPAAGSEPLDMTPQRKKERIFDALLRNLGELARQLPVLMVFEDLHWMDPTSLELLDRTIDRVDHLPVLLIATCRPEFQPPWIGQAHVTMLSLSRLGRREGAALIQQLAGNYGIPADIIEEIIERTDGVPLFLEEVTKVVLEAASGSGNAVAAIPGARSAVPATLQASLMARLDRLGPAAREIAQTGAAIGREFSYELAIAAAPRGEAETRAALDRLVAAGLVFQRGTPPAAEYQFKHALVQDTAYGTLLRGPRQGLHARIAAAIETRMPDRVEREPEILAHHLAEAGQPERAASFWLEAGRRAAGQSANIEAAAHLRRGIGILAPVAETPERLRSELALQLVLGPVVMSISGFGAPEAETAYQRGRELAERLDDDRSLFTAVWGLWLATGQRVAGSHRDALVEELFRVAKPLDDPDLRMQAHHAAWATGMFRGELINAQEHVRQGLELYDRDMHGNHALLYGGHDPGVCAYGQAGISLWMLGYPDQAIESARRAIDLASYLKHLPTIGHALWFAGVVHVLRRDVPAAFDTSEQLMALGREHRLLQYRAIGEMTRGWARARLGELTDGLDELTEALSAYKTIASVILGFFMGGLAETELLAGHLDRVRAGLDLAVEVNEHREERIWMSDILRVKGDLQLAITPADLPAAEGFYRQAIATAQGQQAKSLELRSTTALARLWAEEGRRAEARDLLAPVYDWFTEGFDTADLKEAKALLDGLA
ncbi:MAG TPA: AAA family ATPase [Stellaceae bacterium]|nr:AAA family ATPase [Stellaceae bacterium]